MNLERNFQEIPNCKFGTFFGEVEEIQDVPQYLYLALAIQTILENLTTWSHGTLSETRWLARANKILRFYISVYIINM